VDWIVALEIAVAGALIAAAILFLLGKVWPPVYVWLRWLRDRFWQAITVFRQRPTPASDPPVNIGFMDGGRAIANLVDIDLRSDVPISIQLHAQIPQIFLWFLIVNRSPVDLQFDRMIFTLSAMQPLIYQASILTRQPFPRGERRETIYFSGHLDAAQVAEITRVMTQQGFLEAVRLDVTAYFQAREGWIEVSRNLQRSKVPVG
jgi:hypothetical protein